MNDFCGYKSFIGVNSVTQHREKDNEFGGTKIKYIDITTMDEKATARIRIDDINTESHPFIMIPDIYKTIDICLQKAVEIYEVAEWMSFDDRYEIFNTFRMSDIYHMPYLELMEKWETRGKRAWEKEEKELEECFNSKE